MTQFIQPNWHAPRHVHAFMTTRSGGVSQGIYADAHGNGGLNPATHVSDHPFHVAQNRAIIQAHVPNPPLWLDQTHSTQVFAPDSQIYDAQQPPQADAVVLSEAGVVGAIMTADCLPVLFSSADGMVLAAAHAGWRGLLNGVLEQTIAHMQARGASISGVQIWLGAAIGAQSFEVGLDVKDAFTQHNPSAQTAACFAPHPTRAQHYLADIYALARQRLVNAGVNTALIFGGTHCTVIESEQFYSYRRNGQTGRMACLIWRD
jgi:polyphenol oxidase